MVNDDRDDDDDDDDLTSIKTLLTITALKKLPKSPSGVKRYHSMTDNRSLMTTLSNSFGGSLL